MAYRISIAELGLMNDNTVIEAEAPGDVWRAVAEHLKDNHGIKLPDIDDVGGEGFFAAAPRLDGGAVAGQQGPVIATPGRFANDSQEVGLIVTRLVEKLNVGQQSLGTSDTVPPGSTSGLVP